MAYKPLLTCLKDMTLNKDANRAQFGLFFNIYIE